MSKLLQLGDDDIPEGLVFNKYLDNRLIRHNQNILLAVTGGTGSGKSYSCITIAELWYQFHFKKHFPIDNVCFSVHEVMDLLTTPEKVPRGTLIILEEAGTSLNSLDFQNRISKMFSFVLQSFRSMNVGIIMNLPVLAMLNKSARLLIHAHFITAGLDYEKKLCKLKPYFHQLDQKKGKVYTKYIKIAFNKRLRKVKRFNYSLPPEDLIQKYEIKKLKFVSDMNSDFLRELRDKQRKEMEKMSRIDLTPREIEAYNLTNDGLTQKEIAKKMKISIPRVCELLKHVSDKGYGAINKEDRRKIRLKD